MGTKKVRDYRLWMYALVIMCFVSIVLAGKTKVCAASVIGVDSGITEQEEEQSNNKKEKNNAKSNQGITIQIGNHTKKTKILNGSFVKKKGILYFKKKDGSLAKNGFFTKGKNVYHVGKDGAVSMGWQKIKGHYYFFDRKTGKLQRNKTIDQIRISKKGIAKESKLNIERIQIYIQAQKVVAKVSNPSDSKATKLLKCYKWMAAFPYKQYRTMKTAKRMYPKDWDVVFANDIFKEHKGCCASEACAFAYLAKVCGYKEVTICSDTGHAWVDIGGRLYDPLFAEARSFRKNYNAKYTDYRKHPAYTKKLY